MRQQTMFLAVFSLLAVSCLCTPSFYHRSDEPEGPIVPPSLNSPTVGVVPSPCQDSDCQENCINLLADILATSEGSGSPLKTFSGNTLTDGNYHELVRYQVNNDTLSGATFLSVSDDLEYYAHDRATHQEIWDLFTSIIPADQRQLVTGFIIFTDGSQEILAAVVPDGDYDGTWSLEVDIVDAMNQMSLAATLVHEHAHLLTLGSNQARYDSISCPAEYINPGCGLPGSYIDDFYQDFWVNLYDEWAAINAISDDDLFDQELEDFYFRYQDQFVSKYAATDTSEDIAETWMYYVLSPDSYQGNIAAKKIDFFNAYPELVDLGQQIAIRLCAYFMNRFRP